jgi:hypothetical protein
MPKIKDLPLEERPGEKLLGYGADKLTETEHKMKIRSFLETFLEELVLIYEGKRVTSKIPIDEYFISHLRLTVEALTNSYQGTIAEEAEKSGDLKREIAKWFNE